jgi:hypothetical protein
VVYLKHGVTEANPTTSEFTTTTPALWKAGAFFKVEVNIFVFKTL